MHAHIRKRNFSLLKRLPDKGTYVLIVYVDESVEISVGSLGLRTFLPGCYVYAGSALGRGATSLPNRLARHLKSAKRRHWHIDFLLTNKNASITAIVVFSGGQVSECTSCQHVKKEMKAKILVPGFGASDCANRCDSHLLFLPSVMNREALAQKIGKCLRSLTCDVSIHVIQP